MDHYGGHEGEGAIFGLLLGSSLGSSWEPPEFLMLTQAILLLAALSLARAGKKGNAGLGFRV